MNILYPCDRCWNCDESKCSKDLVMGNEACYEFTIKSLSALIKNNIESEKLKKQNKYMKPNELKYE